MIVIGVLDDMESCFWPWDEKTKSAERECKAVWFPTVQHFLNRESEVDILVADFVFEDDFFKKTYLDSYIIEIANSFSGPILLNSIGGSTKSVRPYIQKVLTTRDKKPPNLDTLISELKL